MEQIKIMFFNSNDNDWSAQWEMNNSFLPQRTIFKRSLPAQLSRGNASFLDYCRPDLKAPLFEPVSEFVTHCKKDTKELCKVFISNNGKFFSDVKGAIEANTRFVVSQEDFCVVNALGYVPSFKVLLELWTNPKQLSKVNFLTMRPVLDKEEVITDLLSTFIMHSNKQLTDTVRRLYGSSMTHPMVQRLMRILTNLTGPRSIIDFNSVSQITKDVCKSLVDILCDAIKRKIEEGNLVTTMALADHVKARFLISSQHDEKEIVMDKALLFHPETFVSMGPIMDINFDKIVERSFYLGIQKWKGNLAKLLICKYLDGHDFEPSCVDDIIPGGDDELHAYLPGRIPLAYKNRMNKALTGPSFCLTSDKQFSVCPIPLSCSTGSSGSTWINVSFETSGGTLMVRIDDYLVVSIEKGCFKISVVRSDGCDQEYFKSTGMGSRGRHSLSIYWDNNLMFVDGVKYEKLLCKPPRNVFFAGSNVSVWNVGVDFKAICRYGDQCKEINKPDHIKKYHHIKRD